MSTRGQPRSVSTESIAAMPLPEVEGETERERSQQVSTVIVDTPSTNAC
jgi:hypothetical protein